MKVNGKVTSPDGPVADAQIILRVGDDEHTVDSEDDGTFRFIDETDLIGKTLICSVSKTGYLPWERPFEFITDEVRPNVQLQPIRKSPWKLILIIGSLILLAAGALLFLRSHSVTVTVPATSNPWLAGMPDRRESPVQVLDLKLKPGKRLTFNVTSTSPSESPTSADGLADMVQNGPEHGISGARGPARCACRCFLRSRRACRRQ